MVSSDAVTNHLVTINFIYLFICLFILQHMEVPKLGVE